MARKLTQQQQRRIISLQQKRNAALNPYDEAVTGQSQTGLLIMRHGRSAWIETATGLIIDCHFRQNLTDLVAGDQVIWQPDEIGGGVIISSLPRQTVYTRLISGEGRPLAANVSLLVIVFAPEPLPTPGLLDKYLLAAELLKFNAILVLNKVDILTADSVLHEQLAAYRAIGYPIIEISTRSGQGMAALKAKLQDQTSVVVGQSGVGKSSLVKNLLPDDDVRIGAISTATSFGRHTTSNARLYHLPLGGSIIDSPGVRDLELGTLTAAQVQYGFIECRALMGQCKFRDCSHTHEPDCAVLAAVASGKISAVRYQHFLTFLNGD